MQSALDYKVICTLLSGTPAPAGFTGLTLDRITALYAIMTIQKHNM
ncbi:MAG: hypothetical protein ACI30S_06800 [Muribaculaceae bacterium]